MEKEKLELYTDYLICNSGFATATGLSAMLEGEISHDQLTRYLSAREYSSKDLWGKVKATVDSAAIFAKACFWASQPKQAAKITRQINVPTAPVVLLHSMNTQQGVFIIVLAMTLRAFGKACIFTAR